MTAAGTLILVVGILFLCWFATKKLAGMGQPGQFRGNGSRIRLLDQVGLGPDKGVALIQVGRRYWLVGVASSGISLLAELDEETVGEAEVPNGGQPMDFKQLLESFKDRKK